MWWIYLKIARDFTHVFSMSLALFDRDGVIHQDAATYIKRSSEWLPILGSLGATVRRNREGPPIPSCGNQAGAVRGLISQIDLGTTTGRMLAVIARMGSRIDRLCCLPNALVEHCSCRKRASGIRELSATPDESAVIGDSFHHHEAALAAGCLPVLVRSGNGADTKAAAKAHRVVVIVDDLSSAVDWLLAQ